jgi:hypothetical protein
MVAFLGFAAQYAATGKGPIDNLIDHVADPVSEAAVSAFAPGQLWVVLIKRPKNNLVR